MVIQVYLRLVYSDLIPSFDIRDWPNFGSRLVPGPTIRWYPRKLSDSDTVGLSPPLLASKCTRKARKIELLSTATHFETRCLNVKENILI